MEGEGLASSTVLLNASSQMERKITHRDAQAFLKSLVKEKWLSEVVRKLWPYTECVIQQTLIASTRASLVSRLYE